MKDHVKSLDRRLTFLTITSSEQRQSHQFHQCLALAVRSVDFCECEHHLGHRSLNHLVASSSCYEGSFWNNVLRIHNVLG